MNILTKTSFVLLATTLAACGSVPKKTFVFDAIDTAETPHACMVVVDDDWDGAITNEQFLRAGDRDELRLTIEFPVAEVEVTVAPVQLNPDGTIARAPRSRSQARETTDLQAGIRRLRMTDPDKQLFILAPR
ncbi:MAG TPA: hypothetical protein ENI87_14210 [bacterium]|nr:hypothetical protein [bacterium]